MSRPQGFPKTGGRRKGTPNRKSAELADQLAAHGIDVVSEILKTLPDLEPKDRAITLMNLMAFLHPKRKAIEMKSSVTPADNCLEIVFVESPYKDEK